MKKSDPKNILFIFSLFTIISLLPINTSQATEADQLVKATIEGKSELFSMEVRDANIRDMLRALAQQSGLNIIFGENVKGTVTLSFKDIKFKDALEIMLRANGLGYTIKNGVVWVGKQDAISKVGDELEEIEMAVIKLNYADPAKIVSQIQGALSEGGSAVHDTRTNSVVIRDLRRNIDIARNVIRRLDIRSTQVLIEARIVEATTSFARQLGIQWGGTYTSSSGNTYTGANVLGTGVSGSNYAVDMPPTSASAGVGMLIGSLSDKLTLDVEISAAERNGDLTIISQPKIATLNNKPAMIHSGLTFRVKLSQTLIADSSQTISSGSEQVGIEEIKTGIDLQVTPQLSDDGFILLDIETEKSDADFSHVVDGIPGITEKSASASILVRDGDTVVLGGLYKTSNSKTENSVPLLGKIPILGWLFKSRERIKDKEELLVFITPKIINYDTLKEVSN